MAWCENDKCRSYRSNILRKADVEFCDETRRVLCHGCYSLIHPGWVPPNEYVDLSDTVPHVTRMEPRMGLALQFTELEGFKAQLSYGEATIAFKAPMNDLKKLFGV